MAWWLSMSAIMPRRSTLSAFFVRSISVLTFFRAIIAAAVTVLPKAVVAYRVPQLCRASSSIACSCSGYSWPLNSTEIGNPGYLKRLTAFKNPEFYAKLGMRLPVYNLPRIISCSEITDDYLIVPRGCEESAIDFIRENNVDVEIQDKTNPGLPISVEFNGQLYPEQEQAIEPSGSRSYLDTNFSTSAAVIFVIPCRYTHWSVKGVKS